MILTTSLVNFDIGKVNLMLGNAVAIIDDVRLLFLLIFGVFLGLWIIELIFQKFTDQKK